MVSKRGEIFVVFFLPSLLNPKPQLPVAFTETMMDRTSNLLDEAMAMDLEDPSGGVVLIEDCVETNGAFILHHLIKRHLSASQASSSGLLIFVAFAQPFSHYDRILRKMVATPPTPLSFYQCCYYLYNSILL